MKVFERHLFLHRVSSRGSWKLFGIILLACLPIFATITIGIKRTKITPNEDFFVISKGESPEINGSTWELSVNGTVSTELQFSLDDIKALPNVEIKATLKCVEGPSGTAMWKGVWASDIIDMAGLDNDSMEVVFRAVDDFSTSLTIEEIQEDNILLAYEMNGVPLPRQHGFPLRVVAPKHWGYKWIKWVDRMEVVDYDYKGFWESRGWADDAHLAAYNDWSIHAILYSIAFIAGVLSLVSGMTFDRNTDAMKDLPPFINRKFHKVSSIAYILSGMASFVYWVIVTYLRRGALVFSLHGFAGLTATILLAMMLYSGISKSKKKPKTRIKFNHGTLGYASIILFIVTIGLGFLRATVTFPLG
ncbi:DUF4079 family protein [Candidatus Bathyarchaeota archaeon]|nr:DUF4079 family protein [Candidatus Bathyarchaeota archaeon]